MVWRKLLGTIFVGCMFIRKDVIHTICLCIGGEVLLSKPNNTSPSTCTASCNNTNKNVDTLYQIYCVRNISGITFIRYTQSQKIGKSGTLKVKRLESQILVICL